MIKFEADKLFNEINKVLVTRETKKSAVIGGRRVSKIAKDRVIVDTFEEARAQLIEWHIRDVEKAKEDRAYKEAKLAAALAYKEI